MPSRPQTIYSNVLKIRTTEAELIFEFGIDFSDTSDKRSDGFEPEIRVVLPIKALSGLSDALGEAAQKIEKPSLEQSAKARKI